MFADCLVNEDGLGNMLGCILCALFTKREQNR